VLLVDEVKPLQRYQDYWKKKHAMRFDIASMLFTRLFLGEDIIKNQMDRLEKEIKLVYYFIGKAETILYQQNTQLALDFLNEILHLPKTATENERLDAIRAQPPGKSNMLVQKEDFLNAIPLWDRFNPATKTLLKFGCGFGLYILYTTKTRVSWRDDLDTYTKNVSGWLQSARGWFDEHVLTPLSAIINQMFVDKQNHTDLGLDRVAVEETRRTLQKMLDNYISDAHPDLLPLENPYSMDIISQDYADAISKPIKNGIFGDLLRLLFIQAEFGKVEMFKAKLDIDKLIAENRFNTQLVVLAPALMVLGAMYTGLTTLYYTLIDDSKSKSRRVNSTRKTLLHMTRVLAHIATCPEDALESEGQLTCLAFSLQKSFLDPSDLAACLARTGFDPTSRNQLCTNIIVLTCLE